MGGHAEVDPGIDLLYYHDEKGRLNPRLLGSDGYRLRPQEGHESLNSQWSRLGSRPDVVEVDRNAA